MPLDPFRPVLLAAVGAAALGLAGCPGDPAPEVAAVAPVAPARLPSSALPRPYVTPAGVRQFAVPPAGRAALRERLAALSGNAGPIADARISNAWQTPAGFQQHPNDYAACVSATTGAGTQTYLIVVSNGGTGDVVGGNTAVSRCADAGRVTSWGPFREAVQAVQATAPEPSPEPAEEPPAEEPPRGRAAAGLIRTPGT